MNQWLESHLRLAERRGLLTGRNLSPVQEFGLRLLIYADNQVDHQRRADARFDALKLALVSARPADAPKFFPEYFDPEQVKKEAAAARGVTTVADLGEVPEGAAIDYSDVEWMSGEEAMQHYDALMAELEDTSVSVGGSTGGEWT